MTEAIRLVELNREDQALRDRPSWLSEDHTRINDGLDLNTKVGQPAQPLLDGLLAGSCSPCPRLR